MKHAALAFESAWQKPHSSRHVSRAWQALGFGKWCGTTSVRVRLEALCLLLEHGVWVREPLSVRVLCEGCAPSACGVGTAPVARLRQLV